MVYRRQSLVLGATVSGNPQVPCEGHLALSSYLPQPQRTLVTSIARNPKSRNAYPLFAVDKHNGQTQRKRNDRPEKDARVPSLPCPVSLNVTYQTVYVGKTVGDAVVSMPSYISVSD